MSRPFTTAVAFVMLLGACTSAPSMTTPTPATPASGWAQQGVNDVLPIVVSSELAVGQNRFLLNLVDRQNEPLAAADRSVTLSFFDLATDADEPAVTVPGTYLPTLATLPGLYRATVELDRAGEWGLEVMTSDADGSPRSGRMVFNVRDEFSTPALGEQAPASETPTAETPDQIDAISTDDDPNPAFYTTAVADALAAGQPFLLIFSTPAFCRTATCGPALDIVKSVAPEFQDQATFIHVEPYELESVDGGLQPVLQNGQLVPVPSVVEWGLLTEPYIFVVNADGEVTAKLEGVASEAEIRAALEEVAR